MTGVIADGTASGDVAADYVAILEKLTGFPTVSSDSNLECIDYIENFLSQKDFQTRRFYNHEKTKANLVAQIGPEQIGGVMLSGHTDVVPVAGQKWESNPFELLEKKGRLYGRGSSDMKGFLAISMLVAAAVDPARLKSPLYLVFTYDEEIGCHGAKSLVGELKTMGIQPQFVLIGEPTNMDLVTAHKGICISTTRIRGKPAHACRPDEGVSAIIGAVNLINRMDGIIPADRDEKFEPPAATFNIGKVTGGNATNIIAQDCSFEWELRPLPSQDANLVQDGFRALVDTLQREMPGILVTHRIDSIVPGLMEGENRKIASELQDCMQDLTLSTASFTTEGGLFQQAGIPAIICGPGHINQAHQPNEYVTVAMMDVYYKFLVNVLEKFMS